MNRETKILHIITGLGVGGAEMMLLKLTNELQKKNTQNIVLVLRGGGTLESRFEKNGIKIHQYHPFTLRFWIFLFRAKKVLGTTPTAISGWMYHGNAVATLLKLFVFRQARCIWCIRAALATYSQLSLRSKAVIVLNSWLSWLPDQVLYNSKKSQTDHEDFGFSANKSALIHNGFDIEQMKPSATDRLHIRNELSIAGDTKAIGLVGRYHFDKDIENYIRAAVLVLEKNSDYKFFAIGAGIHYENKKLAALIPEHFKSNLQLLGPQPNPFLYLNAFDLFVSSSRTESFANAIGEALCAGLPCVATDVGDSAIIVKDSGLIVQKENPEALAQGIFKMLNLPKENLKEMSQKARDRAVSDYNLTKVAETFLQYYR